MKKGEQISDAYGGMIREPLRKASFEARRRRIAALVSKLEDLAVLRFVYRPPSKSVLAKRFGKRIYNVLISNINPDGSLNIEYPVKWGDRDYPGSASHVDPYRISTQVEVL